MGGKIRSSRYRVGLTGAVLEYAIKKYRSHRRLSPNLKLDTIVDEFTEHRKKKMKFSKIFFST